MRTAYMWRDCVGAEAGDAEMVRAQAGGRLRRLVARAGLAAAGLLLAAAVLGGGVAEAQGVTYVSNLDITTYSVHSSGAKTGSFGAQRFMTGSDPDGYDIDHVKIKLKHAAGKQISVSIRKNSGARPDISPSGLVAVLPNPARLRSRAFNKFEVPLGFAVTLDPDTYYWLMFHEEVPLPSTEDKWDELDSQSGTSGTYEALAQNYRASFHLTPSSYQTGAPGWRIDTGSLWADGHTFADRGNWNTRSEKSYPKLALFRFLCSVAR